MQTVQRVNAAVRQCLSDQGTEFAIADACDVSNECAHILQSYTPGQWLFPCAMQVPGTKHILDTILKDAVQRHSWWHAKQTEAKAVCQWLHKKPHRECLQARSSGHAPDMAKTLDAGCEKFADWRRKTLRTVTRDLRRMQRAICNACAGLRASDLGTRDSAQVPRVGRTCQACGGVLVLGSWMSLP